MPVRGKADAVAASLIGPVPSQVHLLGGTGFKAHKTPAPLSAAGKSDLGHTCHADAERR